MTRQPCPPEDLTPNPDPPILERSFIAKDDPRFKSLHCTTIQTTSTKQYSTWFGGSAEGADDIKVWFSVRENSTGTWSDPRIIVGKDGLVHWNPVSFLPDRDSQPDWLIVYYKIDTPIPVWRTHFIETRDGGKTWSEPKELVKGDRSGGRGPQKNPPIVLHNGDWLAGASIEVTIPGPPVSGIWDSFADLAPKPGPDDKWKQGDVWIKSKYIELPADRGQPDGSFPGEGIIQPSLCEDREHPGHVSIFMRSSNTRLQRADSVDGGRTWGPAYDTPLYNNNAGHCVARMRDGRMVAGHNPVAKSWGPRTPLTLAISDDEGKTWRHWLTLEDKPNDPDFERIVALESGIVSDGRSEFSYPCLTPTTDDDVCGVWMTYTWQRRGVMACKVYEKPQ